MAHRTALVAAGSIAIVIVAAAVAVGANLGILDAADSRPVGQLSATVPAKTTEVADTSPTAAATPLPQTYLIRKAGAVSVLADHAGLRLSDVSAKHGWKWTLTQTTDSRLTVTFKSGKRAYTFVALLGPHRTIKARVDHPVTKVLPSAPARTITAAYGPAVAAAPAAAPATQYGEGEREGGGGEADD